MKILLISGHGAGDPGAIGTCNGVTYREADLTREVVSALAVALKGYADVTVYDQSRNAYTDYKNGTLNSRANFQNYDFVLEIHFNAWQVDRGDGKNKGVEIFAKGGSEIEGNIVKNIAALGFTNRGVKSNSFAVINTARSKGTRAALLEVCFIDDVDDMKLYLAKKNDIVVAIAKGFGFSVSGSVTVEKPKNETAPPKVETAATNETAVLYRVQLGAFSVKKNATSKCNSVKAAGFDAFVVQIGALWKVQVGAFKDKANADNMVKKLQNAGFSGLIVKSSATAAIETITVGSTVMVKKGAKTYDGATLAKFVYDRVHDVKQIGGERVVISYNGITVAAVRKSDLILV
jgi:hypothetical protein